MKILLSGGTRCNLTHATDAHGIVAAFGPAGRFLHSALAALGPEAVVELFAAEGVRTKVEPGGKVFPASDRAADVRAALVRRVRRSGCTLALGEPLVEPTRDGDGFRLSTPRQSFRASKVVLATGGKSYPACGTTGDGYRWAAALGHTIVTPHEALVPVTSHAAWVRALQGVTLPDVVVRVVAANRPESVLARQEPRPPEEPRPPMAASRGAMLFAHFGVTGPAVLDVSHAVSGFPMRRCQDVAQPPSAVRNRPGQPRVAEPQSPSGLLLRCDMAPAMTEDQLEAAMARIIAASGNAGRPRCWTLGCPAGWARRCWNCWKSRRIGRWPSCRSWTVAGWPARSSGSTSRPLARWDFARPKSPRAGSRSMRWIRGRCRAGSCRASISRASCSTSTARSAATTFKPRSVLAGWLVRAFSRTSGSVKWRKNYVY